MVHTYSDALPINQTQIFREMVRGMERGLGGKDEERILQHQPASHDVLLHPALDLRPMPGVCAARCLQAPKI